LDVALYTGAGATVRAAWVEGVSAGEILYAEKQFRHLFLPFVSDGQ
jgi:hypothetical protein